MVVSIMSLTTCVALSLYSCCLKETYSLLWSQLFALILLMGASGIAVAILTFKIDMVPSALY